MAENVSLWMRVMALSQIIAQKYFKKENVFISIAFNSPNFIQYPYIFPLLIILDLKLKVIFFISFLLGWIKKRTNESIPGGR